MKLNAMIWVSGFLLCSPLCTVPAAESETGTWQPLFDGKTLNGWISRGGKDIFKVEDGLLVGTTAKGMPNTFLCTEKAFGDFILELEFKLDTNINTGVQFRSECHDQPVVVEAGDRKIKIPAGRVFGYQAEIDAQPRSWIGGIYDQGRRGTWLDDPDHYEAARKAFKPGDWNLLRVVAKGDSLKTYINDTLSADMTDGLTRSGFIAIHLQGSKESGLKVWWRNIRIQDLGKH